MSTTTPTEVLFEAVKSGELSEIKEALRAVSTEELNLPRPPFFWTCLHVASHGGRTNVVDMLLHNGSNPHMRDKAGWCAVDYALKHGHQGVVKLLQAQADEAVSDDDDNDDNDEDDAEKEDQLNLEAGEEDDPLVEEVKPTVQKKKSHFLLPPVARELPDPGNKVRCVEVLLLRGADPDNVDMLGRTPLEYAPQLGTLPAELSHIRNLFSAYSHGTARRHRQGSSNRREHSLPHETLATPPPTSPGASISTLSWGEEEPMSPLSCDFETPSSDEVRSSAGSTTMDEMLMKRRQEAQRRRAADANEERVARALAAEKERRSREHRDRENRELAFFSATAAGDDSRLSRLLRQYPDSISMAPFQAEQTLLHVAAYHGRYLTCELLIDAGADVSLSKTIFLIRKLVYNACAAFTAAAHLHMNS